MQRILAALVIARLVCRDALDTPSGFHPPLCNRSDADDRARPGRTCYDCRRVDGRIPLDRSRAWRVEMTHR